jgi:small subunit ribosomal protein S15
MTLTKAEKQEIIEKYGEHSDDMGSAKVQIALLTEEIKSLTEHLKEHKHDYHSEYGLVQKVNKRRKLMKYLKKNDSEAYQELIQDLKIRDIKEA